MYILITAVRPWPGDLAMLELHSRGIHNFFGGNRKGVFVLLRAPIKVFVFGMCLARATSTTRKEIRLSINSEQQNKVTYRKPEVFEFRMVRRETRDFKKSIFEGIFCHFVTFTVIVRCIYAHHQLWLLVSKPRYLARYELCNSL